MAIAQLASIEVPFNDDSIKLVNVAWSDQLPTRIEVQSRKTGRTCAVEFTAVSGIRILDELDLASIWIETNREKLQSSWMFKISAGGWLELESSRDDFYTKHAPEAPSEYLIAGHQECISILSLSQPSIREVPTDIVSQSLPPHQA